jgi:hypothetical protein
LAWAVLGALLLGAGGWMMYLTRGATFHYDEWNFVVNRRGHSLDTFFLPHNEHVAAVPVFIFKALFETVGLSRYWPYQLTVIVVHLLCALLIYVLARRRLGDWWALIPATVVTFFGASWEAILWPFEISFLIPVLTFLGALLLVGRGDARGDLAATILLTCGAFSSGVGLPLAAGIAAYLLLGRRRIVRVVRVVGLPVVLYAIWNAHYGVTRFTWETALGAPRLMADQLAATLAALAGLTIQFGAALAILLAGGVALHALRNRPLTRELAAASVGALSILAAMAVFRPGLQASRYFYPVGVLVVLALVELAPGYLPRRPTRRGLAVGAVALSLILSGQLASFIDGGRFFRHWAIFVSTSLGALELARDHVEPSFRPDPVRAPDIDAVRYFSATDDWGSPAYSPDKLLRAREDARENADNVLSAALGLTLASAARPASPGPTPTAGIRQGGYVKPSARCLAFEPKLGRANVEVRVPQAGLWLRPERGANAELRLRRFGSTYPANDQPPGAPLFATWVIPPDRDFIKPTVLRPSEEKGSSLAIPSDDASNIPWYALVTSDRPVEICSLGG